MWSFTKGAIEGPLAHILHQLSVAFLPPSGLTADEFPGFYLTRSLEQSPALSKKNCIPLSQTHQQLLCLSVKAFTRMKSGAVDETASERAAWVSENTQRMFCPVMGQGNTSVLPRTQALWQKGMTCLIFPYTMGLNFYIWFFLSHDILELDHTLDRSLSTFWAKIL